MSPKYVVLRIDKFERNAVDFISEMEGVTEIRGNCSKFVQRLQNEVAQIP